MPATINGVPITNALLSQTSDNCGCTICTNVAEMLGIRTNRLRNLPRVNEKISSTKPCAFCTQSNAVFGTEATNYFCAECWTRGMIRECTFCDTYFLGSDPDVPWAMYVERDRKSCCKDCVSQLGTWDCGWCGHTHRDIIDMAHPAGDYGDICTTCNNQSFITCYDCDVFIPRDDAFSASSHETGDALVCEDCTMNHWLFCDNCSTYYRRDNEGCPCSRGHLYYYSYQPRLHFHIGKHENSHKNVYYGAEVELEFGGYQRDTARALQELRKLAPNYIYCKRDACIHDGFEIVTHPFSFRWMKENRPLIKDIFSIVEETGGRGYEHENCGMHVHVNREAFTSHHIYRLHTLLYDFEDLTWRIAGRSSATFREFAGIHKETHKDIIHKSRHKQQTTGDRRCAINMSHRNTVELRIFASVSSAEGFLRNLEATDAAFTYTLKEGASYISPDRFRSFVMENNRRYPNFANVVKGW